MLTCAGCPGPQVPITSSTECANVPGIFDPKLKEFCLEVYPQCKDVTVYRYSTSIARVTALQFGCNRQSFKLTINIYYQKHKYFWFEILKWNGVKLRDILNSLRAFK